MANSEWKNVLNLCDEMQQTMNRYGPGVNPAGLQAVRSLCARMRGTSNYINDRLNKIEWEAERYFSARKWATHARGAEGVKYDIVQAGLSRIRSEATNRMGLME
ncbi:hypothetical protein [Polaromonas hydrogenivorans]|uniref:Uncharacterized protein n=1 Tax=Polaromonas hydrogenivorans TaxID=335476 RepID=A0AAU7LYD8_9BURK